MLQSTATENARVAGFEVMQGKVIFLTYGLLLALP